MRCYDLTDPESRVVGKVLRDQAAHIGDVVWLHSDDRKVTFAQAEAIVNQYARGLIAAGVEKGESVAMLVDPSIEAMLLAMAVTRTGALFTTINTDFHTGFLEDALREALSTKLIVDPQYLPRLDKLPTLAGLQKVFTIGAAPAIKVIEHRNIEDPHYLRRLIDHWRNGYDWRAVEQRLNGLGSSMTRIEGLDVHFLMERGSGTKPLPILLTHGWPGSVAEFLDIIDLLAHPERHGGDAEDGFTVRRALHPRLRLLAGAGQSIDAA